MNAVLQHPGFTVLATALLHSLWLFAIPVALDWLVTRRLPSARHRYLAHLLTLLSWPLLFTVILWTEWEATAAAWSDAFFLEAELGTATTLELTDGLHHLGITAAPRWQAYLALAYLLGLLVALTITLLRYLETRKMRRGGLLPDPELRQLFAKLKEQLLPGREVAWKITDRVTTVLVIGIIRPVILFPVGLVNQLSPDEVAAVLRHELTHLQHYDTLWNAVQELLRAVFFYHPLVYWLCTQLDLEREYACDDAVVRQTDKQIYARALLRVANYSLLPKKPLTMAATNSTSFTQRIQRLFTPESASSVLARTGDSRSYLLPALAVFPLFFLLTFSSLGENPYQLDGETAVVEAPAKEVLLKGTVCGGPDCQPLIGTSIFTEEGNGTITDINGNFEIMLMTGKQKISIYYVGYQKMVMEAKISKDATVDFQLYADKPGTLKAMKGSFRYKLLAATEMPKIERTTTPVLLAGKGIENMLIIIDGKRHTGGLEIEDLDANSIDNIEVIKDKEKLAELGYGTDFKGAILITTKK